MFNCVSCRNFQNALQVWRRPAWALLSDRDKVKAQEVLLSPNALEFMSSEKSDDDGATSSGSGPKRKSRKLVWERSKLTNIKKRMDDAHFEGLSERQRRAAHCQLFLIYLKREILNWTTRN